jgi:hypothetical protein
MGRSVKLDLRVGDVANVEADVVAVKYAEGLFGSALALARALGKTEEDLGEVLASVGSKHVLPGAGRIKAQKALFLSVVSLAQFDYIDVERFAFDVLDALKSSVPEVRHLALTLHGIGFGLSPSKVLHSEIKGCSDAIKARAYPQQLEGITIIDRDEEIVEQLKSTLAYLLPRQVIETPSAPAPSTQARSSQADNLIPPSAGFDVFISYKSADIEHARRVYDLLVSKDLRVFFSKESLPRLGSGEYHKQIDVAIEKTRHMVVVTSSRANVEAKWVEYEWRMFLRLFLKGRKTGNLITVITEEMDIEALPNALGGFEAIRLIPGELERLLEYVKKDESVDEGQDAPAVPPSLPRAVEGRVDVSDILTDPNRFTRIADFFVSRTEVLEDTSWLRAREYAGNLAIDGTGGWRLPTIDQLRHIRTASLFPEEYCYWSRKEAGRDEAYYVHYDDGHVGRGPKTFGNGLRAIFVYEE